jgi:hypothetical protein
MKKTPIEIPRDVIEKTPFGLKILRHDLELNSILEEVCYFVPESYSRISLLTDSVAWVYVGSIQFTIVYFSRWKENSFNAAFTPKKTEKDH